MLIPGCLRWIRLFIATGVAVTALMAGNGRDFAGFYSFSNIEDHGGQIQAILAVRLYNYSGSDLRKVSVTVRETPPGNGILVAFSPVAIWVDKSDVVMRRQVAIPREQFLKWTGHSQPPVFIVFKDESGREFQHTAQVSAHPIAETEGTEAAQ